MFIRPSNYAISQVNPTWLSPSSQRRSLFFFLLFLAIRKLSINELNFTIIQSRLLKAQGEVLYVHKVKGFTAPKVVHAPLGVGCARMYRFQNSTKQHWWPPRLGSSFLGKVAQVFARYKG